MFWTKQNYVQTKRIILVSDIRMINQSFLWFFNQTGCNLSIQDIEMEKLPYFAL